MHLMWQVVRGVWLLRGERNLGLIAAGVAFFGMLAIFPAIAATIAIVGLLSDPGIVAGQIELLEQIAPQDALGLIESQITALVTADTGTLGWATALSIAAALWSARAGVAAMITGLNAIEGAPNRSGPRHYSMALALTLTLIALSIVALFAIVVIPIVVAVLPLGEATETWIGQLRWVAAISALTIAISIIYRFGPNRSSGRRLDAGYVAIFPGVAFSLATWIAASIAFSRYLANFGNYNEVYGSIGAVIALLMWFYISAFLVLMGAALNVELSRRNRN